jgi:O-antigen/teichoic acid export membrane protein
MAYVIQNNTDVLILTVFADLKLVAVYSVYHLVTYSLRSITMSFTGGMEAVFGNMIAKGEEDELMATYRRYKFLLTVLTVTFFGTAGILILPFVKIYTNDVSDVNYMRPLFAVLLIMSDAINCLCWPCFNLTIAANKLKESRLGAYLEAALNVVFSIALVFWDPLVGIAIGTLISAIFKSIYYMVFASRNILKINPLRILFGLLSTCAVLIIVSVCGVFLADILPI